MCQPVGFAQLKSFELDPVCVEVIRCGLWFKEPSSVLLARHAKVSCGSHPARKLMDTVALTSKSVGNRNFGVVVGLESHKIAHGDAAYRI